MGIASIILPLPVFANTTCPSEIEPLVDGMLSDLPAYANRVIARSRSSLDLPVSTYVILAGEPDFEPLPLASPSLDTVDSEDSSSGVQQIFFTTWERSYNDMETADSQSYHWLFLVQTERGWQLDMMFSRSSSYPTAGSVTPPRESSRGTIGRAVQLWLRDCNHR